MTHDGLTSSFDQRHMAQQASFVSPRARHLPRGPGSLGAALPRTGGRAIDEGLSATRSSRSDDFAVDEGPRRDTSLERLAALKPVFDPEGTTTAGNAPGVNDGAGARRRDERGVRAASGGSRCSRRSSPRPTSPTTSRTCADAGGAGERALELAGRRIEDVDRVELNEAFSSVTLNSTKLLGADPERVNVNGGAVALGHPIGASGARILATMIYELRRNGGGLGLAAICSGGGQGDALLIEA